MFTNEASVMNALTKRYNQYRKQMSKYEQSSNHYRIIGNTEQSQIQMTIARQSLLQIHAVLDIAEDFGITEEDIINMNINPNIAVSPILQ